MVFKGVKIEKKKLVLTSFHIQKMDTVLVWGYRWIPKGKIYIVAQNVDDPSYGSATKRCALIDKRLLYRTFP